MVDTNIKFDILQTTAQELIMDMIKAVSLPGETVNMTVRRIMHEAAIDEDFKYQKNFYEVCLHAWNKRGKMLMESSKNGNPYKPFS